MGLLPFTGCPVSFRFTVLNMKTSTIRCIYYFKRLITLTLRKALEEHVLVFMNNVIPRVSKNPENVTEANTFLTSR